MARVLYALTHVASQLIYRWLPPPADLSVVDESNWSELSNLREIIGADCRRELPRLPWLAAYLEKHDPSGERLVAATAGHIRRVTSEGARWICPLDDAYPPLLKLIADPPHGLSFFGDPELLTRPLVAVVGSRKASALAVRESYEIGVRLASLNITVVSGGAFGCDIAAHHGVIATGLVPAPACCIFAGGLDRLYPASNEKVFERLRERRGVLMSERLWGAGARPVDFHGRNRLISGMAGTTLVMQAAERSGALVTARLALDQGRDLAVLRHPEGDVRATGSEALLRDGAPGFRDASDLASLLRTQHSANQS